MFSVWSDQPTGWPVWDMAISHLMCCPKMYLIILENTQIIFEPNLDTMNEDVSQLTYSLAEAFDGLRRLTAISRLVKVRTDSKPSFVDVIDCDDDISKQRRSIMEGMMANKDQCMIYLDNHDKDYSFGGFGCFFFQPSIVWKYYVNTYKKNK